MYSFKKSIILFTPYYTAKTPERQQELDECLQRNFECKHIKKIILLIDDSTVPPIVDDKIEVIYIEKRPTYKQWLSLCDGYKNTITILCNSDIYFDDTLELIHDVFTVSNTFMCLTRYERIKNNITMYPEPKWSQDTWAFCTDTHVDKSLINKLDIPLGVPRCDNKLAYLATIYGFKVVNPVNFIVSTHVHETQLRSYDNYLDDTLIGGVAFVEPSDGIDTASNITVSVWSKNNIQTYNTIECHNVLYRWKKSYEECVTTLPSVNTTSVSESIKNLSTFVLSDKNNNIKFNNTKNKLTTLGFTKVLRWHNSEINTPVDNMFVAIQTNTHIECLFDFLQSTDQFRLIFEAGATTDINTFIVDDRVTLDSFDILYMGGIFGNTSFDKRVIESLSEVRKITKNNFIFNARNYSCFAYLINRRFAHEAVKQYLINPHISIPKLYSNLKNVERCVLIDKIDDTLENSNLCGLFRF